MDRATEPEILPRGLGDVPRFVDMVLGVWLVITPFLWPHSNDAAINAWVTGALVGATAIAALYIPALRFVNSILALWLLASTFLIDHVSAATVWNDVLVAFLLLSASLFTRRRGG